MTQMMRDVVHIQGTFKSSVQLPRDFFGDENNRHFVESYIPTKETLEVFLRVRDSLQTNSQHRTKLFTGTFGTGKSDLMLMIANYVTRPADDPLLMPFFERLRNLDNDQATTIYDARLGKPPFLLVLLQADTANTFTSFVLDGLVKALRGINRLDVIGKTYYGAALDRIARWEHEHPENIERLEKELLTTHGCSLAQLKHELAGPQADAALSTFHAVTEAAIGLPFHETAVIERPYEAFEMAAESLVKSGKYSGIFVVADEFTHLLQKLAESEVASPDIKAIDNLAEAADRSGKNQLHFYVVSLRGFSSAKARTQTSQTALERSGGRFIQGQVELRSQYMEELIRSAIIKQVSPDTLFVTVPDQLDDLLSLAMRLWGNRPGGGHDREWVRDTIVNGCFPFHPLTTYCLPFLNRVLAQNERTMFSFLWDEQRGLKFFIDSTSVISTEGQVSLIPLDYLFSYFDVSLKEKRSDLYLLYQQAQAKLSPEQVNVGLEGRLLKALVLLEVVTGDSNLRADQDSLRHALGLNSAHLKDISLALRELDQAGIAFPNRAGYYLLVKQGHANPSELRNVIELRAQDIALSPITTLNEHYKPKDVNALDYNKVRGTERKLLASFVSVADLKNISLQSSQLQNNDALMWYVITNTEEERLQAHLSALQLTRQHDQLVVAVPLEPTDLLERLKYTIAVNHLRSSEDYKGPDYQELLADNGLVGGDYLSEFERERKKFENYTAFEWYVDGKTTPVQTLTQLEVLATKVMKTLFPSTPSHSTGQHLSKNSRNPAKKEALDFILSAPFRRPSGKKSATDAILSDGAGALGLVYVVGHEGGYINYAVGIPDQRDPRLQNSKLVWDKLEELLGRNIAWSDISQQLRNRPYGLYPSVLALFLAAFVRINRDYIEVSETKHILNPIGVTGDIILKMIEFPKDYNIHYRPLTHLQEEFLRGIGRILVSPIEFRVSSTDALSIHKQVARLLYQKISGISLMRQTPSSEELSEVLPNIPQEVLDVCRHLIEITQLPDEATRTAALLESLPQRVALPTDSSFWTDNDIHRALTDLEKAYKQIEQVPLLLRRSIALQIGQWFGLVSLPKNENEVLEAARRWRQTMKVRPQDMVGKPEAQNVLMLLDDPHSFEQVFLNALPARWKLGTIGEWQGLYVKKEYLGLLEKAKASVEDHAKIRALRTTENGTTNSELSTDSPSIERNPVEAVASELPKDASTFIEPVQPVVIIATHQVALGDSQTRATSSLTPSKDLQLREKPYETETKAEEISSRNNKAEDAVKQAFNTIQSIIESLPPKDQRKLWERLVEEYDPR